MAVEISCKTCLWRYGHLIIGPDGKWRPAIYPEGKTEEEVEDTENSDGTDNPTGECRRFPPEIVSGNTAGAFPMVMLDYWCGEWKPKDTGS